MKYLIITYIALQINISGAQNYDKLDYLQSQWTIIKQMEPSHNKQSKLNNLTMTASQMVLNNPGNPNYLHWEAQVYLLQIENSNKFKSISYAKHARNSLLEAIKLSQGKLKGNIYSTLGYLYLVSPKLSLSLKSKSKEQYYLLKGLQLNPDGLQSNYYYALYLLNKGHGSEIAQEYLIKALNAKQTFLNKDSSC